MVSHFRHIWINCVTPVYMMHYGLIFKIKQKQKNVRVTENVTHLRTMKMQSYDKTFKNKIKRQAHSYSQDVDQTWRVGWG